MIKRWQTPMVAVCLLFLAAVPAYGQRGTIGVNFGESADRFGALPRNTGPEADFDGEFIVLMSKNRDRGADIVAGGEVRAPLDTQNHATEIAFYGGTNFHFGSSFSAGFHLQIHRLYLPPSMSDGQTFIHSRMDILETPGFLQYKFGPAKRAFVRAEGGPEYSPRLHSKEPPILLNPNLDYGYAVGGSVGYVFGKWYAKGTYETRYFKFRDTSGNPNGLYNWRTDKITGGVGFVF